MAKGKYERKPQPKKSAGKPANIVLIVVLAVVLAALLMMYVVPQLLYRLGNDYEADVPETEASTEKVFEELPTEVSEPTEAVAPSTEQTLPAPEPLSFPVVLENGALVVNSVFSYNGIHPESNGENVSDLAAVLVQNTSAQYLKEATITAELNSGEVCVFTFGELPAGKAITLFAPDGETFTQNDFCISLSSEAVFEETDTPDQLTVTAAGMDVVVENVSAEDLTNINIYCRDTLGESYFGGTVYKQTIETLSAGQTATVTVSDSFVGMVEVVRIAINES